MSTNPYQGQTPDQSNQYGGYTGYTPPAQNDAADSQQDGGTSSGQEDYQYGQYNYDQGGQQQQQQQYQYGAYQPPQSALRGRSGASGTSGTSGADDTTSLGINGKTAAAASYILLFFSGIVFFFLERKNRFVRFSAAQSTLLFGSISLVLAVLHLLTAIPLLGFVLGLIFTPISLVLEVLMVVLWIVLTVLAYRGVKVKLPFFGEYAESLVARFTK
jgi:uncharacterized membrane protein